MALKRTEMDQLFEITSEFIELNKLLKASGMCDSGGQAKKLIEEGLITVDGETEIRKRRKIRDGMVVKYGTDYVKVLGTNEHLNLSSSSLNPYNITKDHNVQTNLQSIAPSGNVMKIEQGFKVKIVMKRDQQSGKLTEGVVKDILTNSPSHPHGIKVRLTSGDIGRVQEICQ